MARLAGAVDRRELDIAGVELPKSQEKR